MLVISKKDAARVKNINFHDAVIAKIICDYDKGIVKMPIIMDDTHQYKALLIFKNIKYVKIARKEPWGPGCYIYTLDIEDAEKEYFNINIVLNSGDKITISTSKMMYSIK